MHLYNDRSRRKTLEMLNAALAADPRIAGILLVGSGADGFADEYSDLDLAIVVDEQEDALTVFRAWEQVLQSMLPLLWHFTDVRGSEIGLYALILQDYLEVDISFQSLSALTARSPRWKILLDRTGKIEERQQRTWAAREKPDLETRYARRLDSIWHYIAHVAVAIKREQWWRAAHYLEALRNRTIELEGLLCHCQTRHFREVDRLPQERLAALAQTFPAHLNSQELTRALHAAAACFFDTAARIDEVTNSRRSETLRKAMVNYLKLIFQQPDKDSGSHEK